MSVVLDRDAHRLGTRVLVGGHPARAIRLSPRGAEALDRLLGGEEIATVEHATPGAAALAGRLVRAGLLQPVAPSVDRTADVTVVIPVRDRAGRLPGLLAALDGLTVVVVDDGSADGSAEVARRAGARVIARARPGGPAAARNAGLREVGTELVAFLDSDCTPEPGWLERLAGHLADPAVATVAPRIVSGHAGRGGAVDRYEAARSALDLGPRAAEVRPGGPVPYLPAAALLARTRVLVDVGGFDASLRYGEDVDLVWRLNAAGHAVRYEPAAQVAHRHPATLRELAARRHAYGTAAAPLAARHPGALHAAQLTVWGATSVAATLARRPGIAVLAVAADTAALARRLATTTAGESVAAALPAAAALTARGHLSAARHVAEAATRTWLPATLAAGVGLRRSRRPLAALVLATALADYAHRRPALDPARYLALRLADDAAYCSGVWRGCLRARTTAPLRLLVRRPHGRGRP